MPARGFTLVELLVVVSIIGVLSTVGITVFTGARQSAQDAKRKADIDAIRKAYDTTYDPIANKYKPLTPSDFSNGKIPTPDSTTNTSYFSVAGPGSQDGVTLAQGQYFPTGEAFKVCTPLSGNTVSSTQCSSSASNCYCAQSSQGDTVANTTLSAITNYPSSCDPNGTLGTNLIGHWKMDEASWNGTSGEVKDSSFTLASARSYNGTNTTPGKFTNAGSFNGINNYLEISNSYPFATDKSFTVVAWVKSNKKTPGGSLFSVVDKGFGFSNTYGLLYRTTSDNKANAFFGVHGNGSEQAWTINSVDLSDDNWHLIAGVRDVNTDRIYVYTDNSSSVGIAPDPTTGALNNSSNIRIGARSGGLAQYFSGLIDDVRIYNRALSADEIKALYNNGQGCIPL